MKILYIHQYFCTPKGSGGVRSYEFAKRWVEAGHEVDVICATSSYDPTIKANKNQMIDGIRVSAFGVPYSPRMGFTKRLIAFIEFALKASWVAARASRYDIVLATSTPLTVAIPAIIARWIGRRRVIFEVRDVWPDAAVEIGALKNPVLIHSARILEKLAYSSASHIVPLSTGMADRIGRKGVDRNRMTVIPNCSDLDRFAKGNRERFREEWGVGNRFIILYVGAINAANHIEGLAETIERMQSEQGWEWWFVGNGNRFDWLKQQAKEKNWQYVRLLGAQSREDLADYTAAADCGIVSFVPEPVYYENSPNKFFDYIASGLPTIFTRSTWLEQDIEDHRCGFICSTPEEIVDKLLHLRDETDKRIEMGKNARKLAQNKFSRDDMAIKYLDLFRKTVATE